MSDAVVIPLVLDTPLFVLADFLTGIVAASHSRSARAGLPVITAELVIADMAVSSVLCRTCSRPNRVSVQVGAEGKQ